MRRKWYFIGPLAILAMVLFTFIGGEIVMRLWNWLLPMLFGWRQIDFWQALGLLILCRILFGGLGMRGAHRPNFRRRIEERWERRMEERWERMTPEEREKFRQGMGARCGFRAANDENQPSGATSSGTARN